MLSGNDNKGEVAIYFFLFRLGEALVMYACATLLCGVLLWRSSTPPEKCYAACCFGEAEARSLRLLSQAQSTVPKSDKKPRRLGLGSQVS